MQVESVAFPSAGRTLTGKLFLPEQGSGPHPALVFVHGWASSQAGYYARAEALAEDGFVGLTFDLHGHGASVTADPVESTQTEAFLEDVVAAYDALRQQASVDQLRIGAVGASLGAYLAVWLSTRRLVRWLALRAPADHPLDQLGSAIEPLRRFDGEVLVVESAHDEVVPHEDVMRFVHALSGSGRISHVVINAGHPLLTRESQERFLQILRQWFRSCLSDSSHPLESQP